MFQSFPSARTATHRARKPLVGLVAAVAVASLIGSSSTPGLVSVADSELPVSPGDRVLQSVEIAMGPDGTLTAVDGTTVTASADGESADSTTQAYSPDDVVSDLPVRVLTSYRTADGSGSDLSDLEGYDGQVQVDVTVQNLTVEAEDITYDVPGGSRTRPALVGAPLTIVASADLGGTDPARVVTQSAGEDSVTNGVLSKGADGATQVQWATILAPPQLSSSATLSLVVDAKDFSAPAFDLSVQPGLVTDPSVGALVENAFNPAASEELALQERTVEVVGNVNEVLAEAGDSISAVRESLNSTTETLGQKTVGDLRASITGISDSMEALDGTVTSLGDGISSALETTGSSSLTQLESTVASVDALLGDTTGKPGTATVTGGGCSTTVRTGTGAGSVYDSLLRVAGTLNGYASASDACKEALKNSLANALGPDLTGLNADAVADKCRASTESNPNQLADSVTCSLSATKTRFSEAAENIRGTLRGDANNPNDGVLDKLKTDEITGALNDLDTVVKPDGSLNATLKALEDAKGRYAEGEVVNFVDVYTALGRLSTERGAVSQAVATLHGVAGQNREADLQLIKDVCNLAAPDATNVQPGQLSIAQVDMLRVQLTDASCESVEADEDVTVRGWDAVLAATDLEIKTGEGIGPALERSRVAYGDVEAAVEIAESAVNSQSENPDVKTVRDSLNALIGGIADLRAARDDIGTAATNLRSGLDGAEATLTGAIEGAASTTEDAGANAIDPAIKQVGEKTEQAQREVQDAFTRSKNGMRAAADGIAADGRAAINEQKAGLATTSKESTSEIESNVRQGLDLIADTVSASTRNTDAAGKLLTADLTKVLLDLGDPEVEGAGLLGTLGANAGDARAADFQLALAARTASSYANARGQDIGGLMLRQAQAEAAFKRQAQLQAFQVDVPDGVERRTVYSFHLAAGQ
ncbi:conserved exported hypothetical protein [Nocardioides sp. AX2bis]|nr:conserved exported hypothetical protein [Nocardioides sp. AX2bis]